MIAQAFAREVGDLIRYNSKVVSLQQDENGVHVAYEDTRTGDTLTAEADWCVCTVPFSILGQMDHNLSPGLTAAINNVYYRGSAKWAWNSSGGSGKKTTGSMAGSATPTCRSR